MVLLGELPGLEETVAGKELIQIGEQRGEQRGERQGEKRGEKRTWEKAIMTIIATRQWAVTASMKEKISELTPAQAERMVQFLIAQGQSLDEVARWLDHLKTEA